jgi:hypothetical protein
VKRGAGADSGGLRQLAPAQDRVERLEQRLDGKVALLRLARRDRLDELRQPMAAQPRGDRTLSARRALGSSPREP